MDICERKTILTMAAYTRALSAVNASFTDVSQQVLSEEEDRFELSQLLDSAREDQMIVTQSAPASRDSKQFGDATERLGRLAQLQRRFEPEPNL